MKYRKGQKTIAHSQIIFRKSENMREKMGYHQLFNTNIHKSFMVVTNKFTDTLSDSLIFSLLQQPAYIFGI